MDPPQPNVSDDYTRQRADRVGVMNMEPAQASQRADGESKRSERRLFIVQPNANNDLDYRQVQPNGDEDYGKRKQVICHQGYPRDCIECSGFRSNVE
jgi:hypothetical protein